VAAVHRQSHPIEIYNLPYFIPCLIAHLTAAELLQVHLLCVSVLYCVCSGITTGESGEGKVDGHGEGVGCCDAFLLIRNMSFLFPFKEL
jgi:hypothetical protein